CPTAASSSGSSGIPRPTSAAGSSPPWCRRPRNIAISAPRLPRPDAAAGAWPAGADGQRPPRRLPQRDRLVIARVTHRALHLGGVLGPTGLEHELHRGLAYV